MWYSSDFHLFHKRILELSNRPFSSIEEMHEVFIKNHNRLIGPKDTYYHLGDFSFGDFNETKSVFDRLNGKKHLIIGNHDGDSVLNQAWESVQHYLQIRDHKQLITLFHFPMQTFERSRYAPEKAFHIHGHVHGNTKRPNNSIFDCGVDAVSNKYFPISLDQIREELKLRSPYQDIFKKD